MNTDILLSDGPTRPRFYRRRALAGVAIVAALALAGCGIRVGQPPGDVPSPGAAEAFRQELAVAAATVETVAADVTGAGATAELFAALAAASGGYAAALGGVWVPPPREEDPAPTSPVPDLGPLTPVEASRVITEQAAAMRAWAIGAGTDPDPAAGTAYSAGALTSIWLSWHGAQVDLAGVLGTACVDPCRGVGIPAGLTEPGGDLIAAVHAGAPELIEIYDALGYVNGVLAARGDASAAQVRGTYRQISAGLVADLDGTAGDPRRSAYPLNPDPLAAATQLHAEAVGAWLRVIDGAGPETRAGAIEAMWFHVDRSHAAGPLNLPAWPGLE